MHLIVLMLLCLGHFGLLAVIVLRGGRLRLSATLDSAILIVVSEIAVFTEALGVVRFVGVRAIPCFLRATLSVVAVDAHALGVVGLVSMGAVDNLALLDVVRAIDARYMLDVGTMGGRFD